MDAATGAQVRECVVQRWPEQDVQDAALAAAARGLLEEHERREFVEHAAGVHFGPAHGLIGPPKGNFWRVERVGDEAIVSLNNAEGWRGEERVAVPSTNSFEAASFEIRYTLSEVARAIARAQRIVENPSLLRLRELPEGRRWEVARDKGGIRVSVTEGPRMITRMWFGGFAPIWRIRRALRQMVPR